MLPYAVGDTVVHDKLAGAWSPLTGDMRLHICASDKCGGQVAWTLEYNDCASEFCTGCKEQIDAMNPTVHLTIKSAIVQRVQDTTEAEAIEEGHRPYFDYTNPRLVPSPRGPIEMAPLKGPAQAFKYYFDLWSYDGAWNENPWVVSYVVTVND